MLGGKDMFMTGTSTFGPSRRRWACDKREAASISSYSILVLPTASTPVQSNTVVASLTTFYTAGTRGLLLAALDLACLTLPTARATTFLGLGAIFFLGAGHCWKLRCCLCRCEPVFLLF